MSNPNHTPTPWRAVERIMQPTIHIDGKGWLALAEVHRNPHGTPGEAEANARFIVLAVNHHAALVDELERAFAFLGRISDTNHPGSLNLWLEIKQHLEQIKKQEAAS